MVTLMVTVMVTVLEITICSGNNNYGNGYGNRYDEELGLKVRAKGQGYDCGWVQDQGWSQGQM